MIAPGRDLLLFDIDGTLTPSRLVIGPEMIAALEEAQRYFDLGVVGGSDRVKQVEQLFGALHLFRWSFAENGTVAFENGTLFKQNSMALHLGEPRLQALIDFCLRYIADVRIPVKRGTFIEYRNGMLNASPIGRNCNQLEREEFVAIDRQTGILASFAATLNQHFGPEGMKASLGGQISVDIFPVGWDKTYCLQFVDTLYRDIYFFGDKTHPGGNDYEIFSHPRVRGVCVKEGPERTLAELQSLIAAARGVNSSGPPAL